MYSHKEPRDNAINQDGQIYHKRVELLYLTIKWSIIIRKDKLSWKHVQSWPKITSNTVPNGRKRYRQEQWCCRVNLPLTRNALHWVLPWELITQAHIYFPKIVQQYKSRNEHGKLSQCLFLSSIQKSREHIGYTSNQRTKQLSYTILGGHYTTIKHTIYVSFVDT